MRHSYTISGLLPSAERSLSDSPEHVNNSVAKYLETVCGKKHPESKEFTAAFRESKEQQMLIREKDVHKIKLKLYPK